MDGCRHSRVSSRKLSTLYATNDLYVKTRQQHTTTELTGDSADATNNGYYTTRTDTQDIARSPLAKLLFAIDGVKAVYLGPEKKKQKKRNANPTHVHVPGVDPSQDDIARARELQQIKPPKCFCGQLSRLKKVKKSIAGGEESRAVGNYFFFSTRPRVTNPNVDLQDQYRM